MNSLFGSVTMYLKAQLAKWVRSSRKNPLMTLQGINPFTVTFIACVFAWQIGPSPLPQNLNGPASTYRH